MSLLSLAEHRGSGGNWIQWIGGNYPKIAKLDGCCFNADIIYIYIILYYIIIYYIILYYIILYYILCVCVFIYIHILFL